MGFRFSVNDANIVAYLTAGQEPTPPRISNGQLKNFLSSLAHGHPDLLISSSPRWISEITRTAERANDVAREIGAAPEATLEIGVAREFLNPLRPFFGRFDLFALACADRQSHKVLDEFARRSIDESVRNRLSALFLLPTAGFDDFEDNISMLDPFPAIGEAFESPENWPGFLFWLKSGAAALAPIDDALSLYRKVVVSEPKAADKILRAFKSKKRRSIRILHLSDLHFGTEEAARNEGYVLSHIRSLAPKIDRVAITGDLCQDPDREAATAFRNFRANLFAATKRPVVVVPGNHDQKWMGFGREELGTLADLEWSNLVVDYQTKCVFFCFDSSRTAIGAKGAISDEQMLQVATEFETHRNADPRVANFLPIALLHHHTHSLEKYETHIDTTAWERLLRRIGVGERLLAMDNASAFLKWCATRRIPLIIHGHKHLQRYVTETIRIDDRRDFQVASVGCGTTLGAEGKDFSYNLLTWNPKKRQWAVSFYSDPGDGSGFTRKLISRHRF
jgi:UDP-2,3-diacylglucosamine pyrophosphatase LpxH